MKNLKKISRKAAKEINGGAGPIRCSETKPCFIGICCRGTCMENACFEE
ncbi:bacteriocin-like protein [Chryseobacterium sp. Mn2064]